LSELILKKEKRKKLIEILSPVESESSDYITGPLGIWPFPLLNVLIQVFERLRQTSVPRPSRRRRLSVYEFVRDEKGRILQIIEREIVDG